MNKHKTTQIIIIGLLICQRKCGYNLQYIENSPIDAWIDVIEHAFNGDQWMVNSYKIDFWHCRSQYEYIGRKERIMSFSRNVSLTRWNWKPKMYTPKSNNLIRFFIRNTIWRVMRLKHRSQLRHKQESN